MFYVQPDVLSTVIGGHLWWRRWSPPEEFVILWIRTPDHHDTDTWVLPDDVSGEVDDWDQGIFRWVGEAYQLSWLDDTSTQAMRRALHIEDLKDLAISAHAAGGAARGPAESRAFASQSGPQR